MIGTPAIRNLIRENKVAQMYSAIQTGQNVGMQTLDQCLLDLVRRNVVSAPRRAQGARTRTASPGPAETKTNTPLARAGAGKPWNAIRPSNSCTTCCA
jgi:hypothetical protein